MSTTATQALSTLFIFLMDLKWACLLICFLVSYLSPPTISVRGRKMPSIHCCESQHSARHKEKAKTCNIVSDRCKSNKGNKTGWWVKDKWKGWTALDQGLANCGLWATCFCGAHKLRMVFTFLNGWKTVKRRMLFYDPWNSNFGVHW